MVQTFHASGAKNNKLNFNKCPFVIWTNSADMSTKGEFLRWKSVQHLHKDREHPKG